MANHNEHHRNNDTNGQKQPQVVVVMVPFPAQGHLNQLLHLSRLIITYNIPVHYIGTTIHSRQAKLRVHGWDPFALSSNIHFHEFQTPFLSPPPNPNASVRFPSHLQPAFNASSHLREPAARLLRALSPTVRRLIVVHDSLMASVVQDVVSIPNAEAYTFNSTSAFFSFWNSWQKLENPFEVDKEILKGLPSLQDCATEEFMELIKAQAPYQSFNCGYLYDTCKAIEGQYIDLLTREELRGKLKNWAIGPFNPVAILTNESSNQRHGCLKWLDQQAQNSVIYVSFGTTTSLTDDQIQEIAIGLEKSEQKFIWVVREADKGDIFAGEERKAELPKGYEERVCGRGMVVRDWAPQLEILGHPSTGGFISHCGWNSCMESITMGVPIATWPMHSDQPRNAVLITKVLKIGTVVRDWEQRDELVTELAVENAVRRLIESKEGDEVRKRAAELGGVVRRALEEGGITRMELESFIAHITR